MPARALKAPAKTRAKKSTAKAKPKRAKFALRRAPPGGFGARLRARWRWLYRSAIVGAVLGAGIVAGTIYRHALAVVDAGAAAPAWSVPGHVTSAPIEAWPGLQITAEELATDLVAAGYARVPVATEAGDIQISADAVVVDARAAAGPGWRVPAERTLITFRGDRVLSVTPRGRATFAPVPLATLRAADNENRQPVGLASVPKSLRDAIVAIEDARFWSHPGVDVLGLSRAMAVNLWHREVRQGGSTLTQQLAKNMWLSEGRTAQRKFSELFLALALERRNSKERILELYVNEIYLGQARGSAICGFAMAARAFFGKSIERVDLAEAAALAGIIAAPNFYSPLQHPERAESRRNVVLQRMLDLGMISAGDAAAARSTPLQPRAGLGDLGASFAVDAAISRVEGSDDGRAAREGLTVQSTIQPPLQRLAERAVAAGAAELVAAHPRLRDVQVALVAVRARDGAVAAMVGGRDYAASSFNRVVLAERQAGSTLKPLLAMIGFEVDPALSTATRFADEPLSREHDGKTWTPANYDGKFVGPLSLRMAVAKSRNIPAVLLAERIGLPVVKTRLRALGLDRATDYPSAALGGFSTTPLQLAGAFTPIANGGAFHAPYLVRSTSDRDGKVLSESVPEKADLRYSERATWMAGELMRSVLTEGTGASAARFGVPAGAMGKTGTTDETRDAWMVGIAGPYVVVTWVGFDKGKPLGLTGADAALPTWARFVAGTGLGTAVPARPADVEAVDVCVDTGFAPGLLGCADHRTEFFTAGHVPPVDLSGGAVVGPSASESPPAPGEAEGAPDRKPTGWEALTRWLGGG